MRKFCKREEQSNKLLEEFTQLYRKASKNCAIDENENENFVANYDKYLVFDSRISVEDMKLFNEKTIQTRIDLFHMEFKLQSAFYSSV